MHETYAQNLEQLGIAITLEKVDPSQYTNRRRDRDYDMLYSTRYGSFLSTGGGLSQMYGSQEAEFSLFNPAGLASPLVDAIIEASFTTTTQEETDTALKALDRALRYEFFVVPTGYIADHWVAAYDMYARSYHDSAVNWATIEKDYPDVTIHTFPPEIIAEMKRINQELLNETAASDPMFKEILDSQNAYMKMARKWTVISDYAYLTDNLE